MNMLATWISCAGAILLMVLGRDFKLNSHACLFCGKRGEHSAGCPGRR